MADKRYKRTQAQRDAEYAAKLDEIVQYLKSTPVDEQLTDGAIGEKFNTSQYSVPRARYMIEHNATAEEARKAIRLKGTVKKDRSGSLKKESMAGQMSLRMLTKSWGLMA